MYNVKVYVYEERTIDVNIGVLYVALIKPLERLRISTSRNKSKVGGGCSMGIPFFWEHEEAMEYQRIVNRFVRN